MALLQGGELEKERDKVEVWTEASGSWGCGALWDGQWLQVAWSEWPSFGSANISAKELLPIVVAAATWGHHCRGRVVVCHCDNQAVVAVLRGGYCREMDSYGIPLEVLVFLGSKVCRTLVRLNLEVVRSLVLERHLDVGFLEEVVSRLVEASVVPSTRRTYLSGQRRYFSCCRGVQLSYLPLTEDKACLFVAYLVDSKLNHATIKGYLLAVRMLQVVASWGDPFADSWPRLECALKGIKRAAAVSGVEARVKLPVTPKILKLLRSVWSRNSWGLFRLCCGRLVVCVTSVF